MPSVGASLPRSVVLAYGVGGMGWVLIDRLVLTWLYVAYVTAPDGGEPLLLPLAFGAIMFAGRVVDAVADPVIARWSDNHRGRRGRRVPFLLGSAVPYVLVFVALFHPPVDGRSGWNALHLGVLLALYFALFTAYVGPYLALLADLGGTVGERVDLATAKAVATLVGAGVALIGSGPVVEAFGNSVMAFGFGLLALALLLVPTRIPETALAEPAAASMPLVTSIRTTLATRPFPRVLVGVNALWFGFNLVSLNVALYATSLLGMGESAVALLMGALFGVCLLAFPLVSRLSKRLGLKRVMVGSLAGFAVVLPGIALLPSPPFGIPPLAAALAVMGLAGLPLAGFFIVPDAIVAAVADVGHRDTGQRREAMFFGVQGFMLKLNLGVSTLVSAGLLQFAGDPLGVQLTGPVAGLAVAVGVAAFLRYPEDEVEAARAELGLDETASPA